MYNVAILDDDIQALDIFKDAIESFFKEKTFAYQIKTFSSPLNFLATVKESKYDLVFLDIDMPQKNGIEVGKELVELHLNINIIFLSSREDLVFNCFEIHPFGFIRKSKFNQDFNSVMEQFDKTVLSLEENDDRVDFVRKNRVTSFKANEIVYVEGVKNYQEFHIKDGRKELIRCSMNDLEIKLSKFGFIRVHKGFLVNYLYIRTISNTEIVLIDGNTLPLSRKHREEIIKNYLNISRENNLMFKIE